MRRCREGSTSTLGPATSPTASQPPATRGADRLSLDLPLADWIPRVHHPPDAGLVRDVVHPLPADQGYGVHRFRQLHARLLRRRALLAIAGADRVLHRAHGPARHLRITRGGDAD